MQVRKYVNVVFSIIVISICITLLYGNFNIPIEQPVLSNHIETMETAYAENEDNKKDVQLLARCVNGEARGEPYIGQVAVAAVILNRVKHPSFPNTLAGVIYQPRAFTAVSDGQINVSIDEDSSIFKACTDAMNGWDPSGGAIYYYNPAKTTNKWIYSRQVIKTIGKHKFAK